MEAIAKLWHAHPNASYITISELANELNLPVPWDAYSDWSSAMVDNEGAWKTLIAKARAISKKGPA